MIKKKQYLFLCGCPRSGTSELTRILATHPDFVIGMEKYLNHRTADDISKLTPEIMEKDAFFDMEYERKTFPGKRNQFLDDFYGKMLPRYDSARYVGDKDPTYYLAYDHLLSTFPDVKIICMLRNVYDVAHSWTARSIRRNLPEADYRMGVSFWNDSVKESQKYCQTHPGKIIICEYAKLYSDSMDYYHKLLNWLDVDTSQENETYVKSSFQSKPRDNSEEAVAYIKEHAQINAAASLAERFGL